MSARRGVVVSMKREANGGESPNRYVPLVTVEVRAFWPPLADIEDVHELIQDAADRAMREATARHKAVSP